MTVTTEMPADREVEVLRRIEERVLWLSLAMVDHANATRPNTSGVKVGGHQGSSASMVSAMTALWFRYLAAPDRVSVKPHASPVLHAINYLLGRLRPSDMETLRAFGGLQSYPSRTKDPDPVDFSTGSVGIGATATLWAALAHRYVAGHFDVPVGGRHIALIGDAELDEGAIWEALVDPMVARLGEVMWIVDLNRQSLDRVVPDIAAGRLRDMFAAAGWHTITAKYGRLLGELFGRPGGADLRRRIDAMSNEEYQSLLRADDAGLRERLPGPGGGRALARLVDDLDEVALGRAIRDLGGHDLPTLLDAYREADAVTDRPVVIFAYTLKGWRLPTEGHPANHSALLTAEQMGTVADRLGCDRDDPWATFDPDSDEGRLCTLTAERLERPPLSPAPPPPVPADLRRPHKGRISTQKALGRLLGQLHRSAPEVAERVVTVSPDVATSTNLGGWINHVGVWSLGDRVDWFAGDSETLIRWREGDHGRHVELGIAETNLVGLLGELGLTWDRSGQPLLPIGTLYDPFVGRALEPWSFGIYAGGQSILVGTPSGVSLAPEGGAHQSIVTPSIGIAQPGCTAWEPAFAQDLEWTLLDAMGRLGRPGGGSAYFRLSTRPVDQSLAGVPDDGPARDERRAAALRGGYRLRDPRERGLEAAVTLVGMGAVMPEVLEAGEILTRFGVPAEVVCLTSADLAFRALSARRGLSRSREPLDDLFPPGSPAPLVTVIDGHPSALAFLAGLRSAPIACLGVDGFGQSGGLDDLYRHHGLDTDTIVGSAMDLVA